MFERLHDVNSGFNLNLDLKFKNHSRHKTGTMTANLTEDKNNELKVENKSVFSTFDKSKLEVANRNIPNYKHGAFKHTTSKVSSY